MHLSTLSIWLCSALITLVAGVEIDWTSDSSIKSGAATIAYGLLKYYTGNNTGDTPGNLPDPYYWWEAGAMFGTMVDYWHYTGDTTYVDVTFQALEHQVGDDKDFMPTNQTRTEGNDDQGFWAMAAMTAAEVNFQNPDNSTGVSWLALAQAVFNEYAMRWDTENCDGGLRWQIFTFNNGYTYKNSVSNGCFFNIATRLARYTGNSTYSDWAEKIYDWMVEIKFIDSDYNIYDGAGYADNANCTVIDTVQWTYNAGIFLNGAAAMWNLTGSDTWKTRVSGILARTNEYFFENNVMYEPACETNSKCTTDSLSFKAYLVRWLAGTAQWAPFTAETINPYLKASAKGAALQCSGTATAADGFKGISGTACGQKWVDNSAWDGTNGVGQQLAALSAVFYSQVNNWAVSGPMTADTGGTSAGDASAGTSKDDDSLNTETVITTASRVAAGFLTTALLAGLIGGSAIMVVD